MEKKAFEDLYTQDIGDGETLDWKWNEEDRVFYATDSMMRYHTIKPTVGVYEIEEELPVDQDDEESDHYGDDDEN